MLGRITEWKNISWFKLLLKRKTSQSEIPLLAKASLNQENLDISTIHGGLTKKKHFLVQVTFK